MKPIKITWEIYGVEVKGEISGPGLERAYGPKVTTKERSLALGNMLEYLLADMIKCPSSYSTDPRYANDPLPKRF